MIAKNPFLAAPRCGAKTRKGTPCQAPAMANGRCRLHGGKSTGPRTPEGLERARMARWIHGRRSRRRLARERAERALLAQAQALLEAIKNGLRD